MKLTNIEPRGGTELQLEYLHKNVDKKLLENFQICTSIPGKVPLDQSKINILWQKNSYDQPNLQEFFSNKSRHNEYDWYVFNSHWNYEKFRMAFGIPEERCVVIKNGIDNFPEIKEFNPHAPIRLIFQCTPWRGLNVLLAAMQHVKNPKITLDVYSSTEVYGQEFYDREDKNFTELYEQARQLPNVNYIGYKGNDYILDHISNYQMFAYPSIFEETFCISAAEALSAGLYCITTNYGALYETCSEWPIYVNYEPNHARLAEAFGYAIDQAAEQLKYPEVQLHLKNQQTFYKTFYSWKAKGQQWTNFLQGALNAKQSTQTNLGK